MDRTQSRRQSGVVCSLLVVSLLLSGVVGGEGESIGVFSVDSQWTSTSSVPPNVPPPPPPEDEDCYSEPFDRGPATGPPQKMTNSACPFSNEHHALSKLARGQSVPALSPRGEPPVFPFQTFLPCTRLTQRTSVWIQRPNELPWRGPP